MEDKELKKVLQKAAEYSLVLKELPEISVFYDVRKYREVHLNPEIIMRAGELLGVPVTINPNWSGNYPHIVEAYFYYKGIKFFALDDKGMFLKKEVE